METWSLEIAINEKIHETPGWCDACWLRFGLWGVFRHHNHQPSQKITELVTVSLADKHRWLYRNPHREWRKLQGARKCQRHPPRSQQDNRISTRNIHRPKFHHRSHNIFRPKYARYLKAAQGKSVTLTDLGIFFLANSRHISSFQ